MAYLTRTSFNCWNGNLLCAIDLETTGLKIPMLHSDPHDILQIAFVPVGLDLRPSKEYSIFHLKLQPKRPYNIDPEADKVNRGLLAECITHGMEPWTAVDRFDEWFQRLRLPPNKKLIPLGANYGNFDKLFIMDWLGGPLNYENYIRNDIRDIQTIACYINDVSDHFCEHPTPFPKWNLRYLAALLGIPHPPETAHDAVQDCVTTIECYRKLMRWRDYYNTGAQ